MGGTGRRVISDCTDTYRKIVADCKAADVLVRTYESGKVIIDIPAGFKELEIVTGSGDAELENISAKILKLSTSSGDVEARNIVAEQTEVRTSSGDSEFSGKVAKYFGRSGSGDQEIEIEGKLSEGEFITGSGDADILL